MSAEEFLESDDFILIAGSAAGGILLLVISFICFYTRRRKLRKRIALTKSQIEDDSNSNISSTHRGSTKKLQPVILLPPGTKTTTSLGINAPESTENEKLEGIRKTKETQQALKKANSQNLADPNFKLEDFTEHSSKRSHKKKHKKHKKHKTHRRPNGKSSSKRQIQGEPEEFKTQERPSSFYLSRILSQKDRIKSIFQPSESYLRNQKTQRAQKSEAPETTSAEDDVEEVDDII